MPKTVKMRFYTYKNNESAIISPSAVVSQTLLNAQFLQTVTIVDMFPLVASKYINVKANDIVPAGKYEVFQDKNTNYYIKASKIINDASSPFGRIPTTAAGNIYIPRVMGTSNINGNVNTNITEVFEFYINPQHLTPSYRKLQTEIRTRGGWEVQHWGNALTEVRVQGKSGGLHKIVEGGTARLLTANETVTDSTAWQKLDKLKSIYDNDQSVPNQTTQTLLGMNYYNKFFIGYFVDFTGPEADAMQPYMIDYTFTFKVQDEKIISAAGTGGTINL